MRLFDIWAIGCDYDGCRSVEDLKNLVAELIEISNNHSSTQSGEHILQLVCLSIQYFKIYSPFITNNKIRLSFGSIMKC